MLPSIYYSKTISTPVGKLRLVASDRGLCAVQFDEGRNSPFKIEGELVPSDTNVFLVKAEQQMNQYFAGIRSHFDVKLDMRGTVFQQMAWKALQAIPYGTTATYAQQAATVGDAKKARAVGLANNRNPLPIVVPCHRVVGSDGKLVGYAGGLKMKEQLLNLEKSAADMKKAS